MTCKKCGCEIKPGKMFCVACGTPVQITEEKKTKSAIPPKYEIEEAAQWFVILDGKQVGPVQHSDVIELIKQCRIQKETLLFRTGMEKWVALEQIIEFQEVLMSLKKVSSIIYKHKISIVKNNSKKLLIILSALFFLVILSGTLIYKKYNIRESKEDIYPMNEQVGDDCDKLVALICNKCKDKKACDGAKDFLSSVSSEYRYSKIFLDTCATSLYSYTLDNGIFTITDEECETYADPDFAK